MQYFKTIKLIILNLEFFIIKNNPLVMFQTETIHQFLIVTEVNWYGSDFIKTLKLVTLN
jgi:hypothetical protein